MSDDIFYSVDKPISAADVQRLLRQTEWGATRSLENLQIMLDKSVCVGAWQGETLVGFARAITDDTYRSLIEDVIVDEALRGQGIGPALVQTLLERLSHVQQVLLVCGDHLIPFYEKHGFQRLTMAVMYIWKGDIG
jgi:predicted GNAT family N-acyltransferase